MSQYNATLLFDSCSKPIFNIIFQFYAENAFLWYVTRHTLENFTFWPFFELLWKSFFFSKLEFFFRRWIVYVSAYNLTLVTFSWIFCILGVIWGFVTKTSKFQDSVTHGNEYNFNNFNFMTLKFLGLLYYNFGLKSVTYYFFCIPISSAAMIFLVLKGTRDYPCFKI